MTEQVVPRLAIVLPPPGIDAGPALRMQHALAGHPGRFNPVVLGPPGTAFNGLEHMHVTRSWLPGRAGRRYAAGVASALRRLHPAVIEVHDAPEVAAWLGGRFRPVPVILVVHIDPQTLPGAHDAAARTYLLAQATRVAAISAALRAQMLDGVHPAMRHCVLLPAADGADGAAALADALDTLRLDALKAWSRTLHGPI